MERIGRWRELRAHLDAVRAEGRSVGMVGTSGAMHEGHLSLIRTAAAENDVSALFWGGAGSSDWMSSQIGYERDADRDWNLAEGAGLDVLYAPEADDLFPREPATKVSLPSFAGDVSHLEDPDHLDLIAMIMCRLWNMFGPCRSYFGEKDWQQLVMYQRMADDLAYPVEVLGCPTVREHDGLAVSSRNAKLSPEDRAEAPVLFRGLTAAEDAVHGGAHTAHELEEVFAGTVGAGVAIGYFTAVDAATMRPLDELEGDVRLLASIELGGIRLVDNIGITIT